MYSTCLFCHQSLGHNEVIEAFPVGRRLAYDTARGRLWVVCAKCERWNLTPLDTRWEAIEEAERLFRETRVRVSTDHVGLARLREGLELVRIGEPLRPEMAAWRYGDQFGRRRRRHVIVVGAAVVATTGVIVAGPVLGLVSLGGLGPMVNVFNMIHAFRRQKATVARVRVPELDAPLVVRYGDLPQVRLGAERDGGVELRVQGIRHTEKWRGLGAVERLHTFQLTGDDAVRAAGALLPRVNSNGASRRVVQDAVGLLESGSTPVETFARVAEADRRRRRTTASTQAGEVGSIAKLPIAARLALEMAAHEESERRALEGELAELETAWRQAEEIAAIADELAVPAGVHSKLAGLKGARG